MKTRTIVEIENAISSVNINHIRLFKQSLAIDGTIQRYQDEVHASISCAIVIRDTPVPVVSADLETRILSNASFPSLSAAMALKETILNYPEYAEATKLLAPLFLELEAAKAAHAAETLATDRAAAERQAALDAAKAEALAKIEREFA